MMCFAFLPEATDTVLWIRFNARRSAAEQVVESRLKAMQSDIALAEAATQQVYANVGKAVAGLWNLTKESLVDACLDGRHETIVNLMQIISCFNTRDRSLALHCLALCGPCPVATFGRVNHLIERVWANIGHVRALPSRVMLDKCVWTIECSCSSIGTIRLWAHLLDQYLNSTVWDYQDVGVDGFNVVHEYFLMTLYMTDLTIFTEQQAMRIVEMVELFL